MEENKDSKTTPPDDLLCCRRCSEYPTLFIKALMRDRTVCEYRCKCNRDKERYFTKPYAKMEWNRKHGNIT